MQLALRMVEAAGAGPAIGAAEDRSGPDIVAQPAQLAAQPIQHRLPAHRHEVVPAAAVVRAGSAFQPAAADHGLRDPGAMAERRREVVDDAVGIGIAGMGAHVQPAILPPRGEDTPNARHGACSRSPP